MKKVVSATLAGALAVGMVPAMALADDAVELQTVEAEANAVAGKITGFDTTKQVEMKDAATNTFLAGSQEAGKYTALVPKTVTGGYSTDEYAVAANAYSYYKICKATDAGAVKSPYTLEDGSAFYYNASTSDPAAVTAVGDWAVVAGTDVDSNGINWTTKAAKFSIVAAAWSGVEIYEHKTDVKVTTDQTYTWFKGNSWVFGEAAGNLDVKLGSTLLTEGTDYEVALYDADNLSVANITKAGSYTAYVTGKGIYAGNQSKLTVTIDKLDLSTAAIKWAASEDIRVVADGDPDLGDLTIDGIAYTSADIKFALDKAITGVGDYNAVLSVVPTSTDAANMTGVAKVPFTVVAQEVVPVIYYNDSAVTGADDLIVDRTLVKPNVFDINKLVVKVGTTELDYAKGEYSLVVKKADATAPLGYVEASIADLTDVNTWGDFEISAVINSAKLATPYLYGGASATSMDVNIDNGIIGDASVAFTYKGKLISKTELNAAGKLTYDGKDVMDQIGITVTVNGAVVTSGYEVVITKQDPENAAKWDEVDAIVDAGSYKVVVKSGKYEVTTTNGIDVLVGKKAVDPEIDYDYIKDSNPAFLWTGKDIQIPLIYDHDGKPATSMVAVPEGSCKIVIKSYTDKNNVPAKVAPAAINAAGTYTIDILDVAGDNYQVTEYTDLTVVVSDQKVFVDVAADAWYADEVLAIADAGIMGGYGNSKFGPNDTAERQDVAVMVLRTLEPISRITVSGGKDYTELVGLITGIAGELDLPFSDAKGNAYYSLGVWYANENGIMTGYADSDEFGVGDNITREQVAATLYRIEKGGYFSDEAPLFADVLDAYADADEISKYAVEAMAWAVENGIMGVNTQYLNPGDEITRAELAAMFVRFLDLNADKVLA